MHVPHPIYTRHQPKPQAADKSHMNHAHIVQADQDTDHPPPNLTKMLKITLLRPCKAKTPLLTIPWSLKSLSPSRDHKGFFLRHKQTCLLCLCLMSGLQQASYSQLHQKHYVGWYKHLRTAQCQQWTHHLNRSISTLPQLATLQGLQQHSSWTTSHLLWMQSSHSQSSNLSSSSENSKPSPPTTLIHGRNSYVMQIYYTNMNIFSLVSISASTPISATSYKLKHPLITTPPYNTKPTSWKSYTMKLKLADTSVLPQKQQSRPLLAHSNPLLCLSSLNWGTQINIIYCRTYHSPLHHHLHSQTYQLICSSTHTTSPPLGAPSPSHHSYSITFHPTQKSPPETYQKHIRAHLSTTPNGHPTLSEPQKTHTASTWQSDSAQDHQVEYMVMSTTHHSPYSDHKALAQSPHRSTTTSLRESGLNTSENTTHHDTDGTQKSHQEEEGIRQEEEHGMVEKFLKMAPLRNLLKIADSSYVTCQNPCLDHTTMPSSPTTLPTLTTFHLYSVYLGNAKKTYYSTFQWPTLDSHGTWPLCRSPYCQTRSQNTSLQYKHGRTLKLTPSMRSENSTENYYTSAQSYQEAMLFSPNWRPCSGSLVLILSAHYMPQTHHSVNMNRT